MPHDEWANLNGLDFHYRDWDGSGQSIILLHGLASNCHIWDMVAPILAKDNAVVALDQRGHGVSAKPDDGYDFATVSNDLLDLIRARNMERPIVVGHSWGADVALEFAAAYPEIQKAIEQQAKELLKPGRCLVLADLRPRNVYVNNGQIYLVDFAAAHFGHPSFDLAFYAADLCLKAMLNHPQKAAYLEGINVFWLAYFRIAEYAKVAEVERSAVRDFGCLLLAQVAGRMPVYEGDDAFRDLTYRVAQSLLFTELEKIEDITEFINRTLIDG